MSKFLLQLLHLLNKAKFLRDQWPHYNCMMMSCMLLPAAIIVIPLLVSAVLKKMHLEVKMCLIINKLAKCKCKLTVCKSVIHTVSAFVNSCPYCYCCEMGNHQQHQNQLQLKPT